MKTVVVVLNGVGHVGRRLLELFLSKKALLSDRHDCAIRVIGAVDSSGGAFHPDGLDIEELLNAKYNGTSVAETSNGARGATILGMMQRVQDHAVLLEATPVNLDTGEPGLTAIRGALQRGWDVVSANKGPLVLAFSELMQLAHQSGAHLAYSATVCGGLPAINVGRFDLTHAIINRMEGIVNSTTNYILTEMEKGRSQGQALADAQAAGIAETDPSLDVSGWDAANKLIILTNAVLHYAATRNDVKVTGIGNVTQEMLEEARDTGETIKLVARAERRSDGRYDLEVGPRRLPLDHPLAKLDGHQMGITFETDINGHIFMCIEEYDPTPTAAAMLRDLIRISNGMR